MQIILLVADPQNDGFKFADRAEKCMPFWPDAKIQFYATRLENTVYIVLKACNMEQ